MKRVMIYAYTQFNLGDDLFIKVLCERYPKTNFVLYAPRRYKVTFKEIKNIIFYPSDSIINRGVNYLFRKLGLNEIIRKVLVRKCNAVVQIGGSLFIQGDNWEDILEHTKEMKPNNKPFYLLGTNFGPYKNNAFYESYKNIFGDYTDICFRDQYSYDLFKDLNNTRLADDIIFQLKTQKIQVQENNIVISVIKPSIRKHLSQYDEIYYNKVKDIAIYFIEKGYYVTLMSFCELEGDKEAVGKIVDLIPSEFLEKVKEHYYTTNIEDTLNVIAQSSFIVATRFHSMILGWVFNKPVFPIVYSEKMTNVMKDVGFKGFYTDFKNINNVKPEQVFECIKTNLIDVSKQVDKAEEHFSKLDEYINNDLAKLK
ncbi:polysaccharide pyruvyl transferase family protein [Priestia aryabhattai]|uniref:polysaccharide pyruvyl transferase family protein n=1 Tax=Priestia aryabhattai TaxID=412384 RepID=UPI001FB4466F|nr:polysaccharide pyruvyl transferase family protein [Priestia aryabhattai]